MLLRLLQIAIPLFIAWQLAPAVKLTLESFATLSTVMESE